MEQALQASKNNEKVALKMRGGTWAKLLRLDVIESQAEFPYIAYGLPYGLHNSDTVARVTEIDPCSSPDGCPELSSWQAYVGTEPSVIIKPVSGMIVGRYYILWDGDHHWTNSGVDGSNVGHHHCIDVTTDWAKENYPEHCRIRDYKAPDPFEKWWSENSKLHVGTKYMCRTSYELGQANPTTTNEK